MKSDKKNSRGARRGGVGLLLLPLLVVLGAAPGARAESAASAGTVDVAEADTLDLSAYAGKVVYLDFWASWCAPCLESFPWMESMQRRYGDQGLQVVAVNVDRKRSKAESFLDKHRASFRIVYDTKAVLAKRYKIEVMPTSFLYDRDGTLVATHQGFRKKKAEKVEADIRELLKKKETAR